MATDIIVLPSSLPVIQQAQATLDKTAELVERAESALALTVDAAQQAAASAEALAQQDFFDDGSFGVELAAMPEKPSESRHGKYTGEELERRVIVRDRVVKALAEGVGIRKLARQLRSEGIQIGEHSIMALRDRRPDLVATEKKQLSQQLGQITKLMADSIRERLVNGTMKPTPVDLAVMIDKRAVLDGDATLVIEHKHSFQGGVDDFKRRLEEMKRAKVTPIDLQSTETESKPQ